MAPASTITKRRRGRYHRRLPRCCAQCGAVFKRKGGDSMFCSRSCAAKHRYAANRAAYKKTCACCGVEFEATAKGTKHCTPRCAAIHRYIRTRPGYTPPPPRNKKCKECGCSFTAPRNRRHQKYCSPDCAKDSRRKGGDHFIGPPHRWVPQKSTLDFDSMPRSPEEGEYHYFNPAEVCHRGHVAPKLSKQGRWQCMACQYIDTKRRNDAIAAQKEPSPWTELRELQGLVKNLLKEIPPAPAHIRHATPLESAKLWVSQERDVDITSLPRSRAEAEEQGVRTFFDGVPCAQGHLAPRVIERVSKEGSTRVVCKACRADKRARYRGGKGIVLVDPPEHLMQYIADVHARSTGLMP